MTTHSCIRPAWAWCFALVLALLVPAPVFAREPEFGFPAEVAGFRRGERTDYETRTPGLGYAVRYGDGRWKADIYVYDAGLGPIPDGPASPIVQAQLGQATGDIQALVRRGDYREGIERGAFRFPTDGPERLACRAFVIARATDVGRLDSLLCLTGLRGKFVKFRLSAPEGQASRESAERFLAGWLDRQ